MTYPRCYLSKIILPYMYESEMSWWWDVAILATSNWPQHQQFLKPTHPLPIQRVWWKLKEGVSIETPFSCEARPNRATLEGWDLITSNATCKRKKNANSRQRRCLCQGPRSVSPSEHVLRFTAPNEDAKEIARALQDSCLAHVQRHSQNQTYNQS